MRTTLELPDPLFARLNATPAGSGSKRSAHTLPSVEGPLAIFCSTCLTREHHC